MAEGVAVALGVLVGVPEGMLLPLGALLGTDDGKELAVGMATGTGEGKSLSILLGFALWPGVGFELGPALKLGDELGAVLPDGWLIITL